LDLDLEDELFTEAHLAERIYKQRKLAEMKTQASRLSVQKDPHLDLHELPPSDAF